MNAFDRRVGVGRSIRKRASDFRSVMKHEITMATRIRTSIILKGIVHRKARKYFRKDNLRKLNVKISKIPKNYFLVEENFLIEENLCKEL